MKQLNRTMQNIFLDLYEIEEEIHLLESMEMCVHCLFHEFWHSSNHDS